MIDVLMLQEIEMDVTRKAAQLEEQFQAALFAPVIRAQLVQDILSNPQAAEILRQADPAEYERVMTNIKRMKAIVKQH